jgi:hypothetical protein
MQAVGFAEDYSKVRTAALSGGGTQMDAVARAAAAEANATAIEANSKAINAQQLVAGEESRAVNSENSISSSVSVETSRAQAKELELNGLIGDEVSRAQSAESTNAGTISAEVSRAQSAEGALQTAINNESELRENRDIYSTDYDQATRSIRLIKGNGSILSQVLPAASGTIDGLMSKENYQSIEANTANIAAEVNNRASADAALGDNITAEATARQNADSLLNKRIDGVEGQGGYLPAHDFGSANPTFEELLEYYCRTIWTDTGGVFAYNGTDPKNSTWTMQDGTVHYCYEIFNSTSVHNLFDNHKWILTNTPNTLPPVFYFADVGQDIVGSADETTAGVSKLYNATGNNADGAITQAAATSAINSETNAAQILSKLLTVDGDNSGLDADKLDGQEGSYYAPNANLTSHTGNTSNPHGVTAAQVGLGNVDNTSDTNKPISVEQQTAIDELQLQIDKFSLRSFPAAGSPVGIVRLYPGFVGKLTVVTNFAGTDLVLYQDVYVSKKTGNSTQALSIKAVSHKSTVNAQLSYEEDAEGYINIFFVRLSGVVATYGGNYRIEVMSGNYEPIAVDYPYSALVPIPTVSDGV